MARPRLLLLDEPSEGVQPSVVADIAERIGRIAAEERLAVVLVEQNIDLALELCGRIAFLDGGRVAESVAAEGLRERPELLDRYLAFEGEAA